MKRDLSLKLNSVKIKIRHSIKIKRNLLFHYITAQLRLDLKKLMITYIKVVP